MVNTGEQTTGTTLASKVPEIAVEFNTFTNYDPVSTGQSPSVGGRFCNFSITVVGVKLPLAVATFSRIFNYLINSVTSDVNPISGINISPIPNIPTASGTIPKGSCTIQVNKVEIISTVTLFFTGENLRLDYLDEYFGRTLTYLTEALAGDLNPDD